MSLRQKLRIRSRLRSGVRSIFPPGPKPLILMYHRVADEPVDPWGLAVSSAHFEEQLHVLRRVRHPFPLTDFVRNLIAGTLPPNAVALTFDDGYVDNLHVAKPRLTAADIPATVFLATGYLNGSRKFWWDKLERLILFGTAPKEFEFAVRSRALRCDIGTEPPVHGRVIGPLPTSNKRHSALIKIWLILRRLNDTEREPILDTLASFLTVPDLPTSPARIMSADEVATIAADGLVTVGAHTVTHPVLPTLETAACRREIVESKATCEALTGKPVSTFAYPFGEFDPKSREEVQNAGFAIACSTSDRPVQAASDVLALPRVYVPSVDGNAFEKTLRMISAAT